MFFTDYSKSIREGLVTIGMPVFNGEATITEALDSLLGQTYSDFELFISDNASTDRTGEICKRYQARDNRVCYHRNTENIGPTANFNKLIEMGNGSLFMWAACDDLWEPDFIGELVRLLKNDPSAVLAFCQVDYVEVSGSQAYPGKRLSSLAKPRSVTGRMARFLLFPEVESKACIFYGLIRREALIQVGGVYSRYDDGQVSDGADLHALFLLATHGGFLISEKTLFHKRFQPVSRLVEIMTNPRDIRLEYQSYRREIDSSELSGFKKCVVQGAALLNYLRRLARNLIGKGLIGLRFTSLEPFYFQTILRLQSLFRRCLQRQ